MPFDDEAARRAVAWFQDMGWWEQSEGVTEVLVRMMYWQGCHGDRSVHWSADCRILRCCAQIPRYPPVTLSIHLSLAR